MATTITFENQVETTGYEVVRYRPKRRELNEAGGGVAVEVSTATSQTRMAIKAKPGPVMEFRAVQPLLMDPCLFRNFSTDSTASDVLPFTNRFGMLFEKHNCESEPVDTWHHEQKALSSVVQLWDWADLRCRMSDKELTQWEEEVALRFDTIREGYYTPASRENVESARGYCLNVINDRIGMLLKDPFAMGLVGVESRVDLTIRPQNLIDAMWLQFALFISEGKRYRECAGCGTFFELSPELTRADRRTCSNPCRNREARRRQKQAKEMRTRGMTLKQIVKATGSDLETIKKWLATKED